jgi:hypothetical protein
MTYRSCLEAFEDGVHSRLNYPLHMGLYKLSESTRNLQSTRDEVIRISKVVKGTKGPSCLQHCTNEDKAVWLRKVPLFAAYDLGYEIIPALRALEFDGVFNSQSETAALLVESAMPARLVKWDYLRDSYKNRIASEYARMRNGQSNALLVVDDALSLIESAVNLLPSNIQKGI